MANRFVSGKRGYVTVGSTTMDITGWSATVGTDPIDVTHTGGDAYKEYISGLTGGSGSFDLVFDVYKPPTSIVTGIFRGAEVALVLIIGNATIDNKQISGQALITSYAYRSTREGAVVVTVNFNFTKTITVP